MHFSAFVMHTVHSCGLDGHPQHRRMTVRLWIAHAAIAAAMKHRRDPYPIGWIGESREP